MCELPKFFVNVGSACAFCEKNALGVEIVWSQEEGVPTHVRIFSRNFQHVFYAMVPVMVPMHYKFR